MSRDEPDTICCFVARPLITRGGEREVLMMPKAGIDEDRLREISGRFPGWRIWRGIVGGERCGSWVASRLSPDAGIDATVIRDSADALEKALHEQSDAVRRGETAPDIASLP